MMDLFEHATQRDYGQPAEPPRPRVHINSLLTYIEELANFNRKETLIYGFIMRAGVPVTDREVKNELYGLTADANTVRPRITELKKKGWLVEVGRKKDHVTGKSVRMVKAVTPKERAL